MGYPSRLMLQIHNVLRPSMRPVMFARCAIILALAVAWRVEAEDDPARASMRQRKRRFT
jgi:hypothetical protein